MFDFFEIITKNSYGLHNLFIIPAAIYGVILIGIYVLKSIGIMQMAKDSGVPNAGLAWVPIADFYLLGSILKRVDSTFELNNIFNGSTNFSIRIELKRPELGLLILYLAYIFGSNVPFVGSTVVFIAGLLILLALYQLYKLLDPKNALIYIIISAIIPLSVAVFLFLLKDGFKNTTIIEPPTDV